MKVSFITLLEDDGGLLERDPLVFEVETGHTLCDFLLQRGLGRNEIETLIAEKAICIFGVSSGLNDTLQDGDRVELLDRLHFNPMESRRRRANHKKHTTNRRSRLARPSNPP
jgi:putative ubiquitin-RnfH superfamily antitoxin RatB of RatAB toxin-antitoxin module